MGYKNRDACLDKVGEHEPIFVMRAQDVTADDFVDEWADRVAKRLGDEHPKVVEARNCAQLMREWQFRKQPD